MYSLFYSQLILLTSSIRAKLNSYFNYILNNNVSIKLRCESKYVKNISCMVTSLTSNKLNEVWFMMSSVFYSNIWKSK